MMTAQEINRCWVTSLAIVIVFFTLLFLWLGDKQPAPHIVHLSAEDKKAVLLRICFESGWPRPDAPPICERFRQQIIKEADEAEKEFQREGI